MDDAAIRSGSNESVIHPVGFSAVRSPCAQIYLADPSVRKLVDFFEAKGLAALKREDRCEQWYEDWLVYQAEHHLYASVLAPRAYTQLGFEFSLLRLTRFLEVFGYFSPAHGYSLQVTYLGLFSILMGSNAELKQEAVATIESGGLLAFAVSEKAHGADLLGNEFTARESAPGKYVASGTKYYIGNCNRAAIISILSRKEDSGRAGTAAGRRSPMLLFALRPDRSSAMRNVRKIQTIGVRAAFVGEFEVKDHELTERDVIAEGRDAWDAVFGTVTLGKFFLGFGSIGICEHAFQESADHLRRRILYKKPVIEMPHIRSLTAQAYARLTAMKMYAYRALDYVQAASAQDRRYLLYCAVQKARVSTEGVKVVALLSECIGAKAFESDTYLEMALRDVQLIPSLEGSTHINLGLTAQFIPRYFDRSTDELANPRSLIAAEAGAGENPYLMEARSAPVNTIAFGHFLESYKALISIPNVRLFVKQAKAFEIYVRESSSQNVAADVDRAVALGRCLAVITYGQLIAENAVLLSVAPQIVSVIFHLLVMDLGAAVLALASLKPAGPAESVMVRRTAIIPQTGAIDWDHVSGQVASDARGQAGS